MSMLKFLIALSMSIAAFAQGVDVVKVVSRSAERKVQLPGEFIPFQTVTIHAKVTGFIDRAEVDRGSMVKKGQLLATLDAPELRAQRAEAEAKVLNAESQRAEAEAKVAGVQMGGKICRAVLARNFQCGEIAPQAPIRSP